MSKEEYEKKLLDLKKLLLNRKFDSNDREALYNLFVRLKEKSKPNNFRRDSFSFSAFTTIGPIYIDESNIEEIYNFLSEELKSFKDADISFARCFFKEVDNKDEKINLDFIRSIIEIRDMFNDTTWTEEQWKSVRSMVEEVSKQGADSKDAIISLALGTFRVNINETVLNEILPLLKRIAEMEHGVEKKRSSRAYQRAGLGFTNYVGNSPLSAALKYILSTDEDFDNVRAMLDDTHKHVTFDDVRRILGDESLPKKDIDEVVTSELTRLPSGEELTESESASEEKKVDSALIIPDDDSARKIDDSAESEADLASRRAELRLSMDDSSLDLYEGKLKVLKLIINPKNKYELSCSSDHKDVLLKLLEGLTKEKPDVVSDALDITVKIGEDSKEIRLPINEKTIDTALKELKKLTAAFEEKEGIKGDVHCSCGFKLVTNKNSSIEEIMESKKKKAILIAKTRSFSGFVGYIFDNGEVLFETNDKANPTIYRVSAADLKRLVETGTFNLTSSSEVTIIDRFLPGWSSSDITKYLNVKRGKKRQDEVVHTKELISALKGKGISLEDEVSIEERVVSDSPPVAEPLPAPESTPSSDDLHEVVVSDSGYSMTKEELEALKASGATHVRLVIGSIKKDITIDELLSTFKPNISEATESGELDKTSLEYKKILENRIKRCKEIISKLQAEKHKSDFTEIRIRGYQVEIQKLEAMLADFKGKNVSGVTSLLGSVREGLIESEKEKQQANLADLQGREYRFGLAKKFNERNIKSVQGRIERLQKLDGFCGSIQRSLMCPRVMLAKLGRYSDILGGVSFYQEKVAENQEYKEALNEHKWRIISRLGASIQGAFYKWNQSRYQYLKDKLTDDSSIIKYGGCRVLSLLHGKYHSSEVSEESEGRSR